MITKFQHLVLFSCLIFRPLPCHAQAFDLETTWTIGGQQNNSNGSLNVRLPILVPNRQEPQLQNGLPPVSTDSFVYESGPMAELIYGDEGLYSPPPFDYFTPEHRIEAGIFGRRSDGLTDGHSSSLPTTWGGDEFFEPEPFTSHGQQTGLAPLQQIEPMLEYIPDSRAAASSTALPTETQQP